MRVPAEEDGRQAPGGREPGPNLRESLFTPPLSPVFGGEGQGEGANDRKISTDFRLRIIENRKNNE